MYLEILNSPFQVRRLQQAPVGEVSQSQMLHRSIRTMVLVYLAKLDDFLGKCWDSYPTLEHMGYG